MKTIDNSNIGSLESQFGETFYLLDSDVFENNCKGLMESFRRYYTKSNIAYSYKTNYTPKLVKIVDKLGGYAEVVSEMELDIALKSGVRPEKIVWNGPVKKKEIVRDFLVKGGIVNIDSLDEIKDIYDFVCQNDGSSVNIGIRCNFDVGDGVLSRFGFDVEDSDFDEALRIISRSKKIKLKGLQVHFAKRSAQYWTRRAKGILEIYEYINNRYNMRPDCIDLGGGMSGNVPQIIQKQLNLEDVTYDDYASQAAVIFNDFFKDKEESPWLFVEPGTAVAANSMRYVCKVKTIKTVRDKIIITTNGSQKNISMSGINPPMEIINCSDEQIQCENADIAGYTCIEADYLYKGFNGKIGVGDYLVMESCGSYSVVMKPPFIMPNVPVIDISGSKPELIKRAETFDDLFQTYVF